MKNHLETVVGSREASSDHACLGRQSGDNSRCNPCNNGGLAGLVQRHDQLHPQLLVLAPCVQVLLP